MTPSIDNEEWRPVVGYETHYSVSNRGRVRRELPGMGTFVGKILTSPAAFKKNWYPMVNIRSYGKVKHTAVHRLVADAFIGPRPIGYQVNHKDAVKQNNAIENLEYIPQRENMRHAYDMGLYRKGDNHPQSKITAADILEMGRLRKSGMKILDIAKKFGINAHYAGRIISGKASRVIKAVAK